MVATGPARMTRLKADIAWASGFARLAEWRGRGAPAILAIERVRPTTRDGLLASKRRDVMPERLGRLIAALKRWSIEIVSIDTFCARLTNPGDSDRFVCLTFNGVFHDVMEYAYPMLSAHRVPFTVFIPSAFPDGLALPWWLALERVIASQDRVSMMMPQGETRFDVDDFARKSQLYDLLHGWMASLPPAELSVAVNDLCGRYGVDIKTMLKDVAITWDDIGRLAADPLATIGSATVNYPVLATLGAMDARREMAMGRAVLRAALGRDIRHLAYPFGDKMSFRAEDVAMAAEAGFASAVTTIPGVIRRDRHIDMHALPRLTIDSRMTLRGLRSVLAGVVKP